MELEDERYRLESLIGQGGTSSVFQAMDTELGVRRAIKILNPGEKRRSSAKRRLRAEARIMAGLDHPNILRVYDIGQRAGADYIVMELAEGASLQDRVDTCGPLSPRQAIGYLLQVLSALAAAHDAGVIHRDIKPQNILLRSDGAALLADFGIAMLLREDVRRTRTGIAMGSLAFMAPEQRLDARSVGPRADLYAVAATFYHLMTQANPFDLFAAGEDSPRWKDVPPPLRRVLRVATRYDPDDRYPSARSMAGDLLSAARMLETQQVAEEWNEAVTSAIQRLLDDPQQQPQPLPWTERMPSLDEELQLTHERRPMWHYPAAVMALALMVLFGLQLGQWLGSEAPPPLTQDAGGEHALAGEWQGTLGGFPAELMLWGSPADLRGVLTVYFQSSALPSKVAGTYSADSRTLSLRDIDSGDRGGTYTVNLAETEDSLQGHWTGERDGRILSFEVRRTE